MKVYNKLTAQYFKLRSSILLILIIFSGANLLAQENQDELLYRPLNCIYLSAHGNASWISIN